jgi:glycosyltransferase involved in cell wall biosynthesis
MSVKRMLFHIPEYINVDAVSGSSIRPVKMIEAFKDIGYKVDMITGYGKERQKKIKELKKEILNGAKYEFMYSESSTTPTLLTEKHHLPIYPALDFSFMKFCKCHNIKIGLFYRDIHWNFEHYKINYIKKAIAKCFYYYDLLKYRQLIDILYIPSIEMAAYIPCNWSKQKVLELPPAINFKRIDKINKKTNSMTIFYVGGIGDLYKLHNLFKAVNLNSAINLIACFRKKEWSVVKNQYERYLNNRIKIVHQSGKDIIKYYGMADLTNLFVEPTEYWKFAMPVKLFEYLGSLVPIIAIKGTAAGRFVEGNDIGWTIDYDASSLNNLVEYIIGNKKVLQQKSDNMQEIINYHTWEERAKQVARELKEI